MDLRSLAPELLASVVVHELQEVTSKVRIVFMYNTSISGGFPGEGMVAMDLSVLAPAPVYIWAEFCLSGCHNEAKMKP